MKKTKTLVASLIALVLCFTMVIGTTFAWFTDSVTNTNNIITSGNVNVELWHSTYKDSVESSTFGVGFGYSETKGTQVEKNTELFLNENNEQILWEPGATAVENFRIKNVGTLALKYQFTVKPIYQTATADNQKLSDIIKLYIDEINWQENGVPSGIEIVAGQSFGDGYTFSGELLAGENYDFWVGFEWESNEYDNLYNVEGGLSLVLGVQLVATQLNYEADGFGTDFDKDALYPQKNTSISTLSGEPDYSWYQKNPDASVFLLDSADAVDGLRNMIEGTAPSTLADGNSFDPSFEDKTIVLTSNIDLHQEDENGEAISFDPIGSYRFDQAFKGVFDGNGHTISNLSQNTWELNNGYYYNDLGLGLFGLVEDATIKNLVIDGAEISGESAICGTVAACAYGDCTFENITIKNAKVADYQYYAGGVVGWASGNHVYKNININESNVIGGQWGDFNNANGGVIGGVGGSAKIHLEDCNISCVIDAVNDVVSAYQWYSYRNCGMIIGNTNKKDVNNIAIAPQLTCKNVTVTYGEWANYTYCEFAGTGYPYVRVQAGISVDAYSNIRYGHPTDANGNEVVDDNHVHNEGEDHHVLIAFDQLYGGATKDRDVTYGNPVHEGVTVIYKNK